MELKYEPIGKVKLTKAKYWELKAKQTRNMICEIALSSLLVGIWIGLFLGTL